MQDIARRQCSTLDMRCVLGVGEDAIVRSTPWLGVLERLYVTIPSVWQVGAGIVAWRLLAR